MPLSKLFHKRNSLKHKTDAQLSTQENVPERSDGVDGTKNIPRRMSETPKSGLEMTKDASENIPRRMSETPTSGLVTEDSNAFVEDSNTYRKSSASSEDSQHGTVVPEKAQKTNRSKNRSVSCKESRSVSVKGGGRKKCDSESAVVNSSTEDEGFDDKVLHLKEKELEKVIGQCVNRIIRESIATAVKSVNIDNLYEEVMRDISERSLSESSDTCPSTVEQKLHTKSVTEYVDLDENHEEEEYPPDCETKDYTTSEDSEGEGKGIEMEFAREASRKEQKEDNLAKRNLRSDGYQADVEESESCVSMHSESSSDELKTVENGTQANEESSAVRTVSPVEETSSQNVSGLSKSSHDDATVAVEVAKAGPRNDSSAVEVAKAVSTVAKGDSTVAAEVEKVSPEDDIAGLESAKGSSGDSEVQIAAEKTNQEVLETSVAEKTAEDASLSTADKTNELKVDKAVASAHHYTADKDEESEDIPSKDLDDGDFNSDDEERERKDTLKAPQTDDLILMSVEEGSESQSNVAKESSAVEAPSTPVSDLGENLPEQHSADEEKKVNWKMGYLQVKLPHKTRSKGHLKVWKKRCVAIQPDEFVHDPANPCLMISVYSAESGTARKHSANFWKSVSGKSAVVYRSNSRTHRYAFTVSEDNKAVVHLAADSEAASQEWMAAIRAILWPPSPVVQLEKMLSGSVFEISIIDNDFSYHAGLLGMYGYLTITPKKLILVHPQQGYVIQEWYLNTVDKFQLMPQTRIEDVYKVLAMTTCSDSSTGKGDILIFCTEAVSLLQSLASTIHQLLAYHSTQEGGGIYQKELEEITEWLVASHNTDTKAPAEDYYKVPPKQVKSLLDIPNFIFDKPIAQVTAEAIESAAKPSPIATSEDADTASNDFLNCSITSFKMGGGGMLPGKSSDSELSDSYTPPQSPVAKAKGKQQESKLAAQA